MKQISDKDREDILKQHKDATQNHYNKQKETKKGVQLPEKKVEDKKKK